MGKGEKQGVARGTFWGQEFLTHLAYVVSGIWGEFGTVRF
jgi:hypothetical protein